MKDHPYRCRFLVFAVLSIILMPFGKASSASAQDPDPLTLTDVVQRVLAAHPLTQAAQARVQTALGLARQARAYPNPSFTFTNNDFTFERTYAFSQPLEWPFKRAYRIGVAHTEKQIAEVEQYSIRQELIAIAREAFLTILLTQADHRVATAFVDATRRLEDSTTKLLQAGDIAESEAMKAQVEATRAETDLQRSQGQMKTARSSLNLLLARTADAPLLLQGALETLPPVPSFAELVAMAEEHNPLLLTQRRAVEREQLNLRLALTALVPDVTLDVGHGEDRQAGITGPVVGLTFSLPLWDWKAGSIAAARSKVADAEATLKAVQLQAHQTLLTAYQTWETAKGRVEVFNKGLLTQAAQAATLAEHSYQEGAGDLLGVLDAQRSLLLVRRDYAQALFYRDMAWVAIERTAGIGTDQ